VPLDNGERADSGPSRKIARRLGQGVINKHLLVGHLSRALHISVPTKVLVVSVFGDSPKAKTKKGLFTVRIGSNGQERSSVRVGA
jgi:hypothetical protein